MHLYITTKQAELLRIMRPMGRVSKPELAAKTGKSIESLRHLLRALQSAGYANEYFGPYQNSTSHHELSDSIKSMSDADFEESIKHTIDNQSEYIAATRPKTTTPVTQKLLENKEAVDFIKLNHPFMVASTMSTRLGVQPHVVESAMENLGLQRLAEDQLDPQAHQIISSIKFIPAGSEVRDAKTGGTTICMPCGTPGIVSITRFFGC